MTDLNKHTGEPNESGSTLPVGFIGLYGELMQKGWKQSMDFSNEQNLKTKRRSNTIEIQRMVLEKPCVHSAGLEKIQIIMMFKDGKVECQMYTKPFMSQFFKTSTKDMEHLQYLLQEIEDYYELLNPERTIEDIRNDTRESMKTTQRLVRGADGVLRIAKSE